MAWSPAAINLAVKVLDNSHQNPNSGWKGDSVQVRKPTKLAQKLGQLQPSVAAFPPECTGQLASFGPT
jgi:hypothetical protein